MSQKFEITITSAKALRFIYECYGVARARECLANRKDTIFPGYALAVALIEAEFNNARAEMSGEVLREVARAGYDVGKSVSVHTSFKNGKVFVDVEMPDLGDVEP